eukprot:10592245-Lingulodinium_polyedra.AAC.1
MLLAVEAVAYSLHHKAASSTQHTCYRFQHTTGNIQHPAHSIQHTSWGKEPDAPDHIHIHIHSIARAHSLLASACPRPRQACAQKVVDRDHDVKGRG